MARYENDFKYKMIEELCKGKSAIEIEREYVVKAHTVLKWLRNFIKTKHLVIIHYRQKKI